MAPAGPGRRSGPSSQGQLHRRVDVESVGEHRADSVQGVGAGLGLSMRYAETVARRPTKSAAVVVRTQGRSFCTPSIRPSAAAMSSTDHGETTAESSLGSTCVSISSTAAIRSRSLSSAGPLPTASQRSAARGQRAAWGSSAEMIGVYPGSEVLLEVGRVTIAGSRLDVQMGLLWHHLDRSVDPEVTRKAPGAKQCEQVRRLAQTRLAGDLPGRCPCRPRSRGG